MVKDKKTKVLEAIDLAFKQSAEFTRDERYDQMKTIYLGMREEMLDLDFNLLPIELYKRATNVKGYMSLFWQATDSSVANKAYHIKIKSLENVKALTYGDDSLLPQVIFVLNRYLESQTNESIIENEENLNNLKYLTEKIHESLYNEKRDDNSL